MKKNKIIGILETFIPSVVTAVGFIYAWIINFRIDLLKDYDKLFSNTISFSSIFIGMLITLVGLILGFASKYVIRRIKSKNADRVLISYFKKPIFIGIALVIMCLVLSNLFDEIILNSLLVFKLISSTWLALVIYFLFSTIRVLLLTFMILKEVFYEDTEETPYNEKNKNENIIKFDDDDECF